MTILILLVLLGIFIWESYLLCKLYSTDIQVQKLVNYLYELASEKDIKVVKIKINQKLYSHLLRERDSLYTPFFSSITPISTIKSKDLVMVDYVSKAGFDNTLVKYLG